MTSWVFVPPPSAEERNVVLSNQEKIFWPEERYTKGDLVEYYRAISPWLLPYLAERPVVLTRFPDGIKGKSFYQKDAPAFTPDWLRTERMWSEATQREIDYFMVDDVQSLLYLANLAAIPLHMWLSRVGTLELPDWCVIDLDPKGAPFSDVIRIALAVHALCEQLGLPHYAKTTGSTGIHVLIPLGRQLTYEQSRAFGELLSRVIVGQMPEIATVVRAVQRRDGKVYLDYMQNAHGQLIVSPFSVRPLPGAPVSMPITWDEVNDSLDMKAFTIRTAVQRMEKLGDPMAQVLMDKPDLLSALTTLNELGET
jgi:bifunctional non-homologous end joining protein LigD